MEDHERWAQLEESEAHRAIRESERKGTGSVLSVANADYDAPHRVHINKALLRQIAEDAREQGYSPKEDLIWHAAIPRGTVELATTMTDQELRSLPNGPLRETLEALAMLLGEDIPLATRDWLVDPQIHPGMQPWYSSLETSVRRLADKPGRKGDMGWELAPGYDGRDDDEEAIDKFWCIPDAICLWSGRPGVELLRLEEMNNMYWDIIREPEGHTQPKKRAPRMLPYPEGWVPPEKPEWSPALLPWKTLKADCEWWMRLDRPTCQQWNPKLGKAESAEKLLTGGMREFQHICVGHRKPVVIKNKAPVWDCPKCKGLMHTESWDKMAGILRRNRGNQWERMEQAISTLDWLQEMAADERKANQAIRDRDPDAVLVWVFTSIYANSIKKWLGNTWCLELERNCSADLPGTYTEDGYYREVRRYYRATATTSAERAKMRRQKKKVLKARLSLIEETVSQHDRAIRKIRKTFSRRMENDLGIAWLPKWAAGELVHDIDKHIIYIAEKFGHAVEQFNPLTVTEDSMTWAIKVYFGWSEREVYRRGVGSSAPEHTGYDWNTWDDDPEEGTQRRHPEQGTQVFHDGYWITFDEYRETVPPTKAPWEDDEQE